MKKKIIHKFDDGSTQEFKVSEEEYGARIHEDGDVVNIHRESWPEIRSTIDRLMVNIKI